MKRLCAKRFLVLALLIPLVLNAIGIHLLAAPVSAENESRAEEISVLSVIVNINPGDNEVFTELILQNNAQKEREITFSLPKISAGMDLSSLRVISSGKETSSAEEIPAGSESDGRVTLSIAPGAFEGVSYTYRTEKMLSYEHRVSFDLTQLSEVFQERIAHLEWTADLPILELYLVNEVRPANYTVADNRISVVLNDFSVSPLLDRIEYSQTTYTDLLETLEMCEEQEEAVLNPDTEWYRNWYQNFHLKVEVPLMGYPEQSPEERFENLRIGWELDRYKRELLRARFVAENYRRWSKTPGMEEYFVYTERDGEETVDEDLTLLNLYLHDEKHYSETERARKIEEVRSCRNSYVRNPAALEQYDEEIKEYVLIFLDEQSAFAHHLNEEFSQYGFHLNEDHRRLMDVFGALLRNLEAEAGMKEQERFFGWYGGPAYEAQFDDTESVFYAVILPDLDHERIAWYHEESFPDVSYREIINTRSYYTSHLPGDFSWSAGPTERFIYLEEKDCQDPEVLNDYLKTMRVRCLVRSDFLPEDQSLFQNIKTSEEVLRNGRYEKMVLSFSDSPEYPYEQFEKDLREVIPEVDPEKIYDLFPGADPLAGRLSIPVFTEYWGICYNEYHTDTDRDPKRVIRFSEKLFGQFVYQEDPESFHYSVYLEEPRIFPLLERPIPKKMIEDADLAYEKASAENLARAARAHKELHFPDYPKVKHSVKVPDKPQETMTEEDTLSQTGSQTEITTEETDTEQEEEDTKQENVPEEGSSEAETSEQKSPGLLLLIGIPVALVLIGAAVAVIFVFRRKIQP